jgi:hypothetical protein
LLSGGLTKPGTWYVQTLGVHHNRIYVVAGTRIYSYLSDGSAYLPSDSETYNRSGSNQAILRIRPNGLGDMVFGQNNKGAVLNLNDATYPGHPFYNQTWYGNGINDNAPFMQGCLVLGDTPNPTCAKQLGNSGTDVGRLSYPIDTALTPDGRLAVLENGIGGIARVSIVNLQDPNNPVVNGTFASSGDQDGQLSSPFSIVRVPANDHYVISDSGNRRLSEFTAAGVFVASYGQGVLTGGSEWEQCGPGAGPCEPGTGAYYGRLDIGTDGRLYAQYAGGTIQVLDLGTPAGPSPQNERIRLVAGKRLLLAGERTKLTATLAPASVCPFRKAQFQWKVEGKRWKDLGRPKRVKASCQAKKKSRPMSEKTTYRALSVDSIGDYRATSPKVVLKLVRS